MCSHCGYAIGADLRLCAFGVWFNGLRPRRGPPPMCLNSKSFITWATKNKIGVDGSDVAYVDNCGARYDVSPPPNANKQNNTPHTLNNIVNMWGCCWVVVGLMWGCYRVVGFTVAITVVKTVVTTFGLTVDTTLVYTVVCFRCYANGSKRCDNDPNLSHHSCSNTCYNRWYGS